MLHCFRSREIKKFAWIFTSRLQESLTHRVSHVEETIKVIFSLHTTAFTNTFAKNASAELLQQNDRQTIVKQFSLAIFFNAPRHNLPNFFARNQDQISHADPTSLRGSDTSFAAAYIRECGHVEILNLPVAKVKVGDREKALRSSVRSAARCGRLWDCGSRRTNCRWQRLQVISARASSPRKKNREQTARKQPDERKGLLFFFSCSELRK